MLHLPTLLFVRISLTCIHLSADVAACQHDTRNVLNVALEPLEALDALHEPDVEALVCQEEGIGREVE